MYILQISDHTFLYVDTVYHRKYLALIANRRKKMHSFTFVLIFTQCILGQQINELMLPSQVVVTKLVKWLQ